MYKIRKLKRTPNNPEIRKIINCIEMYGIIIFTVSLLFQFLIISNHYLPFISPLLLLIKPFLSIIIVSTLTVTLMIITFDWLKSAKSPIRWVKIKHQLELFTNEFIPEGVEIRYAVSENYKQSADKIRVILYSNGYLDQNAPVRIGRQLSEWFNIPLRIWLEDEQYAGHYIFELSYKIPVRKEITFDF